MLQRASSHAQMNAVGCGIVEVNPPQHSIKQREKCGLAWHDTNEATK
jgi:hypothetical protein